MIAAIDKLTRQAKAKDRFDYSAADIRPLQIEALNERFQGQKDRIKLLGLRARDAGTTEITAIERRSAWWVLAGLGRRLGYEMPPTPDNDGREDDDAMLAAQVTAARAGFADITASRYAESGYELPAPWVDDFIAQIGGWRLAPPQLVAQLAGLSPGEPGTLRLIPRRQKRHVNSQLTFLGDQPEVLLHPDDAAAAGLTDGAAVVVRNQAGKLDATARVDPGMRRGVVSVPHGYADANVNQLTSHLQADPLTGMARYSGIPVSVHPAGPR